MKKEDKWLFADTEDNSLELQHMKVAFSKKLIQLVAIDENGNRFHFGDKRWKFLRFVLKGGYTKVVFHNSQYDMGSLFFDRMDELDKTLVGGRLIKAVWKGITFLDSLNMFPMSVKKLAPAFGLEKLETDVYSEEYAFTDVEVIRRAMIHAIQFAGNHNCDLPSTLGSLAMRLFKTKYHNWKCDDMDARRALFGGRVELFQKGGDGQCWYCDINSLYPHCMTKMFPSALEPQTDLDCYGVANVTITIPDCFIAPLPYRREDGAILFPTGKLTGTWTTHEIRNAIQNGAKVEKLHWCKGSKTGKPYYKKFILNFYQKRLQAESDAMNLMLKLLMNSSYGQLGMSGNITKSVYLTDKIIRDVCSEDHELTSNQIYGCKMLKTYQMPLPDHVNYIHAAYVTSYGRIELYNYLKKVKPENLVYCDTDSVISFGSKCPFPVSDGLGRMKLEKEGTNVMTFAPKCYKFDNEYKAKGVKKENAEKYIKEGEVTERRPFKIREAARFFDRGNIKPWSVWHEVTKSFGGKYDKKILKNDRYFPLNIKDC